MACDRRSQRATEPYDDARALPGMLSMALEQVVPGTDGAVTDSKVAEAFVEEYGLPVIIKAAMGGGGKGMRVVRNREDLVPFFQAASRCCGRFDFAFALVGAR